MNKITGRRTVVFAIAAAALIAAVRAIHNGETPRLRILIGAFFGAGVLAMLADAAPQAAASLALIVLIAAIITNGEVFDQLTTLTGPGASAPTRPADVIAIY